jgi:class 3 adenylate cyclase
MNSVLDLPSYENSGDKEKRHLAVVFIDLVESTRIGANLNPERFHDLISRFLNDVMGIIEKHDGYVARFMGDGVLAYFGFPSARENDSVKAIEAALAVKLVTGVLALELDLPLAVRVGIATGPVIMDQWIGKGSARERPISGLIVNLASRLQSSAKPNVILVSGATHQLTKDFFEFQLQDQLTLKGLETVSEAFEVLDARSPEVRLGENSRESIHLVSRKAELTLCSQALSEARQKKRVLLAITGEAGIGKSALVRAFMAGLHASNPWILKANGDPSATNEPYFLAKQLFGSDLFSRSGTSLEELTSGAIAALVRKDETLETEALNILVVEDIHWADPSSLDLLGGLLNATEAISLLLVCTSRTQLPAQLSAPPHLFHTNIQRFNDTETRDLLLQEVGADIDSDLMERILKRADGVPLFALELSRLVKSSDGANISKIIPLSLSEMLSARLSQLKPAFRFAQCLSVLGLSCELSVLVKLAGMSERQALHAVQHLNDAQAIRVSSVEGVTWMHFEHSLIRDAVYETLFEEDKKQLHRQAAALLDGTSDNQSSLEALARHCRKGEQHSKAVVLYLKTAQRHHASRSYREAERVLERGFATLESIPLSNERLGLELELQSLLASVLQINFGYSNPRARAASVKAKTLAEKQGEFTRRFAGLAGEWMAASSAGEFVKAHEAAERMRSIALTIGSGEIVATSWMALLTSRFRIGNLLGAETAFIDGRSFFSDRNFLSRPGAIAQTYGNAALVSLFLGDHSVGRSRAAFAIRNSRRMGSDYDLCFSTFMGGMVCLLLGSDKAALRLSGISLKLASKHNFPQFAAIGQIVHGRALAGLAQPKAGIELVEAGVGAMKGTGSKVGLPLYLTWLAEAHCFAGQQSEALPCLERALTVNEQERYFFPEILRLKSRLVAATGNDPSREDMLFDARTRAEAMQGQWFLNRMSSR